MVDIYKNKSRFKIGVVLAALLIAGASLYYTNSLVQKLAEREERLIDLYSQALQYVVQSAPDDDQLFFINEVIQTNESIPVLLVRDNKIIDHKNINIPQGASEKRKQRILAYELELMKSQHKPIVVDFAEQAEKNYVYYRDSDLLFQLRYYPSVLLTVIFSFGFLAYLAFSYSRRAEQNRVWVGLAKETAHQLGTPISSLMAWIEYLKQIPALKTDNITLELEKDVKRLEMVTARFSSIGSEPTLKSEDIYFIVLGITNYLQRRISSKVKLEVKSELPRGTSIMLNRHLFEWVIENICKNAVDAMNGVGEIKVHLLEAPEGDVIIDISDTGKGMTKQIAQKVFSPGFTTKKRGWGLGLTLAKRIIENYHKGKLFVKQTELDKGTTFRMVLQGA
ncbi:MAG: ATP-binding protein [Microscillaceae bacterium]|jgi:signal transduction histidine kinase|nr:ATP-binding protein [Microscillaceae bacterium]